MRDEPMRDDRPPRGEPMWRGRRRHFQEEWGPGRGGRMRRGETRAAVLAVLAERPGHGYEIIQTLEEKSGGSWRPSPGSIYPTLQLLEDEGLVRAVDRDGKRVYELTDEGRQRAEAQAAERGGAPWERGGPGRPIGELKGELHQMMGAMRTVFTAGTPAQTERAVAIVRQARKELYQMMAED